MAPKKRKAAAKKPSPKKDGDQKKRKKITESWKTYIYKARASRDPSGPLRLAAHAPGHQHLLTCDALRMRIRMRMTFSVRVTASSLHMPMCL